MVVERRGRFPKRSLGDSVRPRIEFEPFTRRLAELDKDRAGVPLTDEEYKEARASILEDLATSRRTFRWKGCLRYPAIPVCLFLGVGAYMFLGTIANHPALRMFVAFLVAVTLWFCTVWWVQKDPAAPKLTPTVRLDELEKIRTKNLVTQEEYDQLRAKILASDS